LKKKKKKKSCGRVWTADSEGNLFVWKGESRYKKIEIKNNAPITSLCFSQCNEGINVWVGTKLGQTLIYEANNCSLIKSHKQSEELKIHYVSSINDQIWITGDKSPIAIYGADTYLFESEINEAIGGYCIIEVNKSHVWIADKTGGINIIDTQSKCCIKRVDSLVPITCLLALDEESIWSGSGDNSIKRWFFSSVNKLT